jgi:hypothetical protein
MKKTGEEEERGGTEEGNASGNRALTPPYGRTAT